MGMMHSMMDKMMKSIPPEDREDLMVKMMPMMQSMPTGVMDECFAAMRKDKPETVDAMGEMMRSMMPVCISHLAPQFEKEKPTEFATTVIQNVMRSTNDDMTGEERKEYFTKCADTMKAEYK